MSNQRLLPAYPLFVKDPFFSIWSKGEILNESPVSFWTGSERRLEGYIVVDGHVSSFLGQSEASPLKQTSISVTALKTSYSFIGDGFTLDIDFVSPLLLENLELLSMPLCYLDYSFKSEKPHSFEIALFLHEGWCSNESSKLLGLGTNGRSYRIKNKEVALIGNTRQSILSGEDDEILSDSGYFCLAGEKAYFGDNHLRWTFVNKGGVIEVAHKEEGNWISVINTSKKGSIFIGREEKASLEYFGVVLPPYYYRKGKNLNDAIIDLDSHKKEIDSLVREFDLQFEKRCKTISDAYYQVGVASYRQCIAAHKVAEDRDGNLLFVSKECGSNGCAATADVAFPSAPLFLIYNPLLIKGMLNPLFKFARTEAWDYDFAPHDLGTFPFLNGQVYGLITSDYGKEALEERKKSLGNHLPHYLFGATPNQYDFSFQMPLEESANLIILSYQYWKASGDVAFIKDNFDLLKLWEKYLEIHGYCPENQLTTDDFSGHVENSINLSIKAAVGIKCFIELSKVLRVEDTSLSVRSLNKIVEHIEITSEKKGFLPLSFNEDSCSYSLKYNLACDKVLGFSLFSSKLLEREEKIYSKFFVPFGLPLDERSLDVKSDWDMWVASIFKGDFLVKTANHLKEFLETSPERVPFSDYYDGKTGKVHTFKNRTVQGGIFFPLLTTIE